MPVLYQAEFPVKKNGKAMTKRSEELLLAIESPESTVMDSDDVAILFNAPSNSFNQTDYVNRLCVSHEILKRQLQSLKANLKATQ